jgi:copper oxidase (laccase) domain-containing protein
LLNALKALGAEAGEWLAWIGPAISQSAFEVGEEVRSVFLAQGDFAAYFKPASRAGHWLADLPGIAQAQMQAFGQVTVTQSGECTYRQAEDYFSYRRDTSPERIFTGIYIRPVCVAKSGLEED